MGVVIVVAAALGGGAAIVWAHIADRADRRREIAERDRLRRAAQRARRDHPAGGADR